MIAYLERVDFGYRLKATIFLVVVREEHDVFAHSLHIRVGHDNFVILQLWVKDSAVKGTSVKVILSLGEDHTECDEKLWDACGVGH